MISKSRILLSSFPFSYILYAKKSNVRGLPPQMQGLAQEGMFERKAIPDCMCSGRPHIGASPYSVGIWAIFLGRDVLLISVVNSQSCITPSLGASEA